MDGKFTFTANGQRHEAGIAWDSKTERYEVRAPTLKAMSFVEPGDRREVVSYLNEEQALRVVPTTKFTIYSHGQFFKPVIPVARAGAFQLLDVLTDAAELAEAGSEKGDAIVGDDWDPDSVFGLLSALDPSSARLAPAAFGAVFNSPDMVLCTDLGAEVADFVVTQGKRIAFIHAKASSTEAFTRRAPSMRLHRKQ